jgi:hypothetical protein
VVFFWVRSTTGWHEEDILLMQLERASGRNGQVSKFYSSWYAIWFLFAWWFHAFAGDSYFCLNKNRYIPLLGAAWKTSGISYVNSV